MKPMELISLLDSGMVEELKMYYNGQKTVVNIHSLPETMPDYEINKLWNSEDGKGISVLLADNLEYYPIPKFVEDKTYTDMRGKEGMTNKEAIMRLQQIEDKYIHGGDEEFDSKRKEAIAYAIAILEKQSSYERRQT